MLAYRQDWDAHLTPLRKIYDFEKLKPSEEQVDSVRRAEKTLEDLHRWGIWATDMNTPRPN